MSAITPRWFIKHTFPTLPNQIDANPKSKENRSIRFLLSSSKIPRGNGLEMVLTIIFKHKPRKQNSVQVSPVDLTNKKISSKTKTSTRERSRSARHESWSLIASLIGQHDHTNEQSNCFAEQNWPSISNDERQFVYEKIRSCLNRNLRR
ncbi:hypothetical protein RRG08_008515 [Elysia crispata]|uniref:Uncharacterized protein n=1 Tax=Elysia crispata TaxID=231223 RepID=A0AAE1DCR9_9GAST|nr:hypothetical protein RRG08_008515 [Elysia crispata]